MCLLSHDLNGAGDSQRYIEESILKNLLPINVVEVPWLLLLLWSNISWLNLPYPGDGALCDSSICLPKGTDTKHPPPHDCFLVPRQYFLGGDNDLETSTNGPYELYYNVDEASIFDMRSAQTYWGRLATPTSLIFISEHGKEVRRTVLSDLLMLIPPYYCKGGQSDEVWSCCGFRMKWKRFTDFYEWVRSRLSPTSWIEVSV